MHKVRKRWLKRYFSLRGHYFKYFGDEGKDEMKGAVDVNGVSGVTLQPEEGKKGKKGTGVVLKVDVEGAKPLLLMCKDAQDGKVSG